MGSRTEILVPQGQGGRHSTQRKSGWRGGRAVALRYGPLHSQRHDPRARSGIMLG